MMIAPTSFASFQRMYGYFRAQFHQFSDNVPEYLHDCQNYQRGERLVNIPRKFKAS